MAALWRALRGGPLLTLAGVAGAGVLLAGALAVGAGRSSGASPAAAAREPVAAFLGDSYTAGVGASVPSRRWTSLVAASQGWREVDLGVPGTGYYQAAAPAVCGALSCPPYWQRVDAVAASVPDVVVVSGGVNDLNAVHTDPAVVATAVRTTLADLRRRLPSVCLVVTGPVTPFPVDSDVLGLDAAVRSAAVTDRARYIDLLRPDVLGPGLVASDGLHPDDAGHAAIARRVDASLAATRRCAQRRVGRPSPG